MTAACPVCSRPQDQGLLCSNAASRPPTEYCTQQLERELGDVAAVVAELDITLSKQGRLGAGGPGGLARERLPLQPGAMDPIWVLGNVLTTWARDVCGDQAPESTKPPAVVAAWMLLSDIDRIRRHPAVEDLHDEVVDAVGLARRTVDRAAERKFLGPCWGEFEGVKCVEDLYVHPAATHARCRVCGSEVDVVERRAWLLEQAEDVICTVKEASRYLGEVGGIRVSEASIRGYLHRARIAYRPGGNSIRLGDLLEVVLDDAERKTA